MTCLFNPAACIADAFGAWFWWLPYLFWGIVAIAALWALAKVKQIGGYPALAGVAGFAIYVFGFMRGRRGESFNPIENLDHDSPDAAPIHRTPKAKRRIIRRTSKRDPLGPERQPGESVMDHWNRTNGL